MNIFTTSACPIQSAKALPDVLVIKMIVESAQLLSTAHFENDGVIVGYKPTHKNHPCAIFTRKTSGNYEWVYNHFVALCDEFTRRKGKVHKTSELIETLKTAPRNIRKCAVDIDFMCMPDDCKKTLDVHKNYQIYLKKKYNEWLTRTDKKPIVATWTNAQRPEWA